MKKFRKHDAVTTSSKQTVCSLLYEVRGLSFDVEGLHIEVGAKDRSGGLSTPAPTHFNHCLINIL